MTSNKVFDYLYSTDAIRERCQQIFHLAQDNKLEHFSLHQDKLQEVSQYVVNVIRDNYPNLDIPYHSRFRHLSVGGKNRVETALKFSGLKSGSEQGRMLYEMIIVSILLDAGAGATWIFKEGNEVFNRSEGLAIASFHAFKDGVFSSQSRSLQVNAGGLKEINSQKLERSFQVSPSNPLVGVEGRKSLMNLLGRTIAENPSVFKEERLGSFYDYVTSHVVNNKIPAKTILSLVLEVFSPIWPPRHAIQGKNLGDCWPHPQIKGLNGEDHYIPFHKLSQWMTYSLFEPLEMAGIEVENLDDMTGLPEYRNGGLFLDLGLISLKDAKQREKKHPPGSTLIVEWRALTVCLLDEVTKKAREILNLARKDFPLAKVLEGGTWQAGRKIAKHLRADGSPPINIDSDGTVF